MTKRTKPRKAGRPKLSDAELVDRVTLLFVTLLQRSAIEAACRDELGLSARRTDELIDQAAARVQAAAAFDRDAQLGRAITRLDDLYQRSLTVQDVKTALAAQRELNRLLRLHEPTARRPADATGRERHRQAAGQSPTVRPLDHLRLVAAP